MQQSRKNKPSHNKHGSSISADISVTCVCVCVCVCQCYPLQVILRGRLLLSPSRHGVIRCVCEPLWLCVVVTACTFVRVRVQVAACICQREFSVRQDGDSLLCVVYESGDKNLTDPTDSTIWETTLFTKQLFPLTLL